MERFTHQQFDKMVDEAMKEPARPQGRALVDRALALARRRNGGGTPALPPGRRQIAS